MTFLEWNNRIARYFFNPDQAGREVRLFITKSELILLGRQYSDDEESDEDIWTNFLAGLRIGFLAKSPSDNIFEKAAELAQKWHLGGYQRVSGQSQDLPPYLSCLVFAVLPLLEIQGDYNTNNYYDRMDDFIRENQIFEMFTKPKKLQNLRNKLRTIDNLWADLSNWANVRLEGRLGTFSAISFNNAGWKFVGKPLSQCILSPTSIRKLPEFFFRATLVPTHFYSDRHFRDLLLNKGGQWLGLRSDAIELIKKDGTNELTKSIIELIKTEFAHWTGEQQQTVFKENLERVIRTQTVIPLKLQFKRNNSGEIFFSYRAYYQSDPPKDLTLGGFENIYQNEHWSRTLPLHFSDQCELIDYNNKWKAVFEFREIRLFINGRHFHLSSQFWVETVKLSRVDEMYLLCKDSVRENVKNWCENGCSESKECSDFVNLPKGYFLFWFRKPQISHPHFEMLQVFSEKSIVIREGTGLKVGYNCFLDELLPQVELVNAQGDERLRIAYQDGSTHVQLNKHPDLGGIWSLPAEINIGRAFSFKLEGVLMEGVQRNYELSHPNISNLSNDWVPKRNGYGNVTDDEGAYFQGNLIVGVPEPKQLADLNAFTPSSKWVPTEMQKTEFPINTLLHWLITVRKTNTASFNQAFELIYREYFPDELADLQHKRRSTLNLLDHLGYIDYDYRSGKIFALPPKLITIPTDKGRKGLLIGCYSDDLLQVMSLYCESKSQDLAMYITPASGENFTMLLPARVSFECNNVSALECLASLVSITFDEWYLLKLKALLPTLSDYRKTIFNSGPAPSWDGIDIDIKVFGLDTLCFRSSSDFDKSFTLVECRPRYVPEYGLWVDEKYYEVEKNWGKYLLMHHYSEKLPTFDQKLVLARTGNFFRNDVELAIPAQLPFPRLYARMIMQLTGEAPMFRQLELTGKRMSYNVYKNISGSFIDNLFKFKLNIEILHYQL